MPGGVRLVGDWEKFGILLDGAKFGRRLMAAVGKATKQNALDARKQMRQEIKNRVPPGDAKLTERIKRSTKPLVDRGDLWKAITSVAPSWDRAFVGLLRTSEGTYNLGVTLHEGQTIRVSEAMRAMFWALMVASTTGRTRHLRGRALELWERNPRVRWHALRADTKAITIPARPFVRYAMKDPAMRKRIHDRWRAAVESAFRARPVRKKAGGGGAA